MTNIRLDKIGDRYYAAVNGHANYAEEGKDIVCAAISSLIQSYIFVAEELQDNNKCTVTEKTIDDGLVIVVVNGSAIDGAYAMLKAGLEAIAFTYPSHVKIVD